MKQLLDENMVHLKRIKLHIKIIHPFYKIQIVFKKLEILVLSYSLFLYWWP